MDHLNLKRAEEKRVSFSLSLEKPVTLTISHRYKLTAQGRS